MGNIAPKFLRSEYSNARDGILQAFRDNSLQAFKTIVLNPALDEEQRKTLLNSTNDDGLTLLHEAALFDCCDTITWLLSDEGRAAGFDSVLTKGDFQHNALHVAVIFFRPVEVCKAIVNGCREDERKELLNALGYDDRTVLHLAAFYGQPEMIRWLLTDGVAAGFDRKNITALTKQGLSCLHNAAFATSPNVQALLSHCSEDERAKLFLCIDGRGWTALHHAARRGDGKVIELLQHPECSLIVNRKDDLGMTALHRLIVGGFDEKSRMEWSRSFKPNSDTVRELLESPSTAIAIDPNIGFGLE